MIIVEAKKLNKKFLHRGGDVHALKDVDLKVNKGEILSIVGTSGSGKSTLLHMLGGLDNPTSGEVYIDSYAVNKGSENDKCLFRRRNVGFIFQEFNLIPLLNAWENVILPLQLDNRTVDMKKVDELFSLLKLEHRKDHLPNALSGGERQRVAIARALITEPAVILADEPTGSLDPRTSKEVLTLMRRLVERYNQTLIIITHDDQVAAFSDRIIRIEDGKILDEDGNI